MDLFWDRLMAADALWGLVRQWGTGFVLLRCHAGLCPLQVATGSKDGYMGEAIDSLGMSETEVVLVVRAADGNPYFDEQDQLEIDALRRELERRLGVKP